MPALVHDGGLSHVRQSGSLDDSLHRNLNQTNCPLASLHLLWTGKFYGIAQELCKRMHRTRCHRKRLESGVERVYQMLLTAGYPTEGVNWLRRHRLAALIVMAVAAWALFIGAGWLVWSVLT